MIKEILTVIFTAALVFLVLFLGYEYSEQIGSAIERFSRAGKRRKYELEQSNSMISALENSLDTANRRIEDYKAEKTYEANAFRSFNVFGDELLPAACKLVGLDVDTLDVTRTTEYMGSTAVHRFEFDDGLSAEQLTMDGEYYIRVTGQDGLEDFCIGFGSDGLYRYTLDDVHNLAQYLRGVPVEDSTRLDPTMVSDRI